MGQWKVAVLTPEQINKLKEGGEFEDALYYAFPETFPHQRIELLHGEVGRWKGYRVLDYDKVQISPGIEVIERSRERERIVAELQRHLDLIRDGDYWMKGDADEEET